MNGPQLSQRLLKAPGVPGSTTPKSRSQHSANLSTGGIPARSSNKIKYRINKSYQRQSRSNANNSRSLACLLAANDSHSNLAPSVPINKFSSIPQVPQIEPPDAFGERLPAPLLDTEREFEMDGRFSADEIPGLDKHGVLPSIFPTPADFLVTNPLAGVANMLNGYTQLSYNGHIGQHVTDFMLTSKKEYNNLLSEFDRYPSCVAESMVFSPEIFENYLTENFSAGPSGGATGPASNASPSVPWPSASPSSTEPGSVGPVITEPQFERVSEEIEEPVQTPLVNKKPASKSTTNGLRPLLPNKCSMNKQKGKSSALAITPNNIKKISKRARHLNPNERIDAARTRRYRACVRCTMQKIKCRADPGNPSGPCLSCCDAIFSIFQQPCSRYKITDSTLFRTSIPLITLMSVGPKYGNFHIPRNWTDTQEKTLYITQDRGTILTMRVREFTPPPGAHPVDTKGNSMYVVPWAMANVEEVKKSLQAYIDESVGPYLDALLDDTDPIVWNVFHTAYRVSIFPEPNKHLSEVLRLWVACRFIEGGWRCCGNDNVDADKAAHPYRPADRLSPPPFIDYELASISMQDILEPLRKSVLKQLQDLIQANKASNWFVVFLATFIVLHNFGLGVAFQRRFATRRNKLLRYMDMQIIRAIHSAAKTILTYFHYCCKGQHPFQPDFDWKSEQTRNMAGLDREQVAFMETLTANIRRRAEALQEISGTDKYEDSYWFISQLFEENWAPKQTPEHSPPQ
ncbi:hypothetical protein H072_9850 [Dactylellina haptotyla CBS 200.50]|uniref:Zn(2)-C6 fungal-type domain-containing protein n=1 Tax=Dactylellina haptotyla (strain CBS 200.50) TaxID=1284197 RepID=S8A0S8_DACHA|nr:hypothetical protein H072_9850 [Dactylellina haptotyla CBS 200.50]